MKKILESAIITISALGWWGFVYPELCLTEEIRTEGSAEDLEGACEEAEEYEETAEAIRIKSRFAEYAYEIKKNMLTEKRPNYDK